MGKMRNAESKMWNQKCGMTLIGRGVKPRDRWLSADYHISLSTDCGKRVRPMTAGRRRPPQDTISSDILGTTKVQAAITMI